MSAEIEGVVRDCISVCTEKHPANFPQVQSSSPDLNVSDTTGIFIMGHRGSGKTTILRAVNENLSSQYETLLMTAGVATSLSPLGQQEYILQAFGRQKIASGKSGKLLLVDDIHEWHKSTSLMSMLVSLLRMESRAIAPRVFLVATLNSDMLAAQVDPLASLKLPGRCFFSTVHIQNLKPEERMELLVNLVRTSQTAFRFGSNKVIPKESQHQSDPQTLELIEAAAKEISMDTMASTVLYFEPEHV